MSRTAAPGPGSLFDAFDSIPAILWTLDAATLAFTFVSRGAEKILGYPVDAWFESADFWRDHIHPDDRYVVAVCHSECTKGNDHDLVYRMIAADGRIVWIQDNVRVRRAGDAVIEISGMMLDITSERQAHDALARSEENYRRLVHTAPDAIGVHTKGRFIYVNPKFVEVFGGEHESDLIGREVLSLVHPDFREIVRHRQVQVAVGNNAPMTREKLMRIDGTPFDAEVMAIPVVFNGAKAVQVIARDITDRIRTEERLQLLAAATNEAIWEGSYVTNEFWTNDAFRNLFGGAPDFKTAQVMWVEHIHPADQERVTARLRERIAKKVLLWSDEYRMRTLSGKYVWVLDRGRRLLDANGEAVRVIGAILDVTSLREAEQRYRQIVEQAHDVIYTLDTRGHITSLNPAFENTTGFKVDDWIGKSIAEIFVPDDIESAFSHFRRALEGKDDRPRQYRIRTAAGQSLEIEASGEPLVINGATIGTIGVVRDVTERNLLQRKIEEAGRIASLGQLAASIAHEFNNVLMTIQSFNEVLARTTPQKEPARGAQKQISDAVARGKRVTDEILVYAKPKPPNLEPIPASNWLTGLLTSIRPAVPDRIDLHFVPNSNDKILGDKYQLEQVIMNLVVNARDAMPAGGTLTIEIDSDSEAWRKRVALDGDTRYLRLTVRDTGTGIPANVMPSIFEPLFTTKRGGTGLGLPIAKRLVERQNGTIAVESTIGEGTAFHLFLPMA